MPKPTQQTLVRLSCLHDDAQGTSLDVVWDLDVDAQLISEASWQVVAQRGFDPPRWFSAHLHTLHWQRRDVDDSVAVPGSLSCED